MYGPGSRGHLLNLRGGNNEAQTKGDLSFPWERQGSGNLEGAGWPEWAEQAARPDTELEED